MPTSDRLTVRCLRRPLVALTVLSLTTASTPAFALRGTIEAGAEEKVAQALRPATPSNVGLEEDVSRFALPNELAMSANEAAVKLGNNDAELFVLARQAHEDGVASLKAGDYATALERFMEALAKWDALLQRSWAEGIRAGWVEGIRAGLHQARRSTSAAQSYAQARQQASGPGMGFEYYESTEDSRAAYANIRAVGDPLGSAIKRVEARFPTAQNISVVVTQSIKVFIAEDVRRGHEVQLDALQEDARRLFYADRGPVFQDFNPSTAQELPLNAVVLHMADRRPAGLRPDVAAVDIRTVKSLAELIQQARAYQLGKPAATLQLLDAVLIGDKVFHFFA